MPRLLTVFLSLCLVFEKAGAQIPFNNGVLDATYDKNSSYFHNLDPTKSITSDNENNIYLFAIHDDYPNPWDNYDTEIIKLRPNGIFDRAVRLFNTLDYTLVPRAIISANDNTIVVLGDYWGLIPSTFEISQGSIPPPSLKTMFYAKFDSDLNLISFKLHNGAPFNFSGYDLTDSRRESKSIVRATENEENVYFVLSEIEGHPLQSKYLVVAKLDKDLNVLYELLIPDGQFSSNSKIYGNTIDLLLENDLLAVTGFIERQAVPTPCIFLLNKNLSIIGDATEVSLGGLEHFPSLYGIHTTNAIEAPGSPNHIIWGFPILPTGTVPNVACAGFDTSVVSRGTTFLLKQNLNLDLVSAREYDVRCNIVTRPLMLRINQNSNSFTIGGWERVWKNTSSYSDWHVNPVLMSIRPDLMPIELHRYNNSDNPNQQLHSFDNFYGNLSEPSFILHTSTYIDNWSNNTVRVINTFENGLAECSERMRIESNGLQPILTQWNMTGQLWEATGVGFEPLIAESEFRLDRCRSDLFKTLNTEELSGMDEVKVFPNPTNGALISIEGLQGVDKVELHDIMGRVLVIKEVEGRRQLSFDLTNLTSGAYLLKLAYEDGRIRTEKVIIN